MNGFTTDTPSIATLLSKSVAREYGPTKLRVEGTLPESLSGTLYRTGPAAFEVGGKRVSHVFEADGGVSSVRFGHGDAYGAYQMVASEGRKRELAAGVPLYGTTAPWHRRMLAALKGEKKNTGNTNVLFHQAKLYALEEGSPPTELDPESLATIGETRFGDTILGAFSAHPHRVAKRKTTYNFGLRYGRSPFIDLYALPDEGAPSRIASIPLPAAVLLHDFIATENHLIFFVAPMRIVMWRAMLQVGSFSNLLRYEAEQGTEIIVVPIDRPELVRRFTVDSFFLWHFANAFECGGQIVVDFVRYPDGSSLFAPLTASAPTLDLGAGLVRAEIGLTKDTFVMRTLEQSNGDFPITDPRFAGAEHNLVFRTFSDGKFNGLSRYDARKGHAQFFKGDLNQDFSEAIFVPKDANAREGEGHLLSLVLDAHSAKSHIAVLDAEHIESGPIALVHFEHSIPITFHGTFVPA